MDDGNKDNKHADGRADGHADKYKQVTILQSVKSKDMWMGSKKPTPADEYMLRDGKYVLEKVTYAPALAKMLDEILANAIDQFTKSKNEKKLRKVSKICISFAEDGVVSVFNNGNGIPFGKVKNVDGKEMYIAQLICSEFLAGENNKEDPNRISGGTNGLGIKITAAHSSVLSIETVDLDTKKHYYQEFLDELGTIQEPVITNLKDISADDPHKKGGTTVKFKPVYGSFEMDIYRDYNLLHDLFLNRAIQTAAHTGIDIYFNNESIKEKYGVCDLPSYAALFIDDLSCFTMPHPKYPWSVAIGISNSGKCEMVSIVNGLCIKSGVHLFYIRDFIASELKDKAQKLLSKYRNYNKSMIQNNLFIIMSGNIPNPNFNSQTKSDIAGSAKQYEVYKIAPKDITKIWNMLKVRLADLYLNIAPAKKPKNSKLKVSKCRLPKYLGASSTMIICEGDSAQAMAHTALTSKETGMNYDYYGTFTIGGIPMNARDKTKVLINSEGKEIKLREKELVNNERWSSLVLVLGLDYNRTYETEEDMETLNFGCVVIAVDQDLDGVGQICGLLMSNLHLFWPQLIRRGYVKHFSTPILRAFPVKAKKMVESFYSEGEYLDWLRQTFGGKAEKDDKDALPTPTGWIVKYYKGLATHNDVETKEMFSKFRNKLYTLSLDGKAHETYNIYFGRNADLRKKELSEGITAVMDLTKMDQACSDYIRHYTRKFQLSNLVRLLPCVMDGLNEARRKIVHACIIRFKSNNDEIKVAQLASYCSEKSKHQHNADSLSKAIINMAQAYIGANNAPVLIALSQFGSRINGGNDAGAPRYIKTTLNKNLVNLLFRQEDMFVLNYAYDEGERIEPKYYVPTIPYILLESLVTPATGWKHSRYALDWPSLYVQLRQSIETNVIDIDAIDSIPFWKNGWTGHVEMINGDPWFMGSYSFDKKSNTLTITELPFQVWNSKFIEKLESKKSLEGLIVSIDDRSTNKDINIKIKLKSGAMDQMGDDIYKTLGLRKKMDKHLNMIKDNTIFICDNYSDIFRVWFVERKLLYKKRFKRLRELTRLKILFLKEVIKFVEKGKKYDFSVMDEEKAINILKADGYIPFNKPLLDNPQLTPVSDMERLICGEGSPGVSYEYLFEISPKKRLLAARTARAEALKNAEEYYAKIMEKNIVKKTWLEEVDEINEVIVKATSNPRGWAYDMKEYKYK